MALPWQAEKATDPRLLVLNEPLAVELGLDPELKLLQLIDQSVDRGQILDGLSLQGLQIGAHPVVVAAQGAQPAGLSGVWHRAQSNRGCG